MAIDTDFEVQAGTKNIRYIGAAHTLTGAGYYTGLELHRWLQDLADDPNSTPDDFISIASDTPSDKAFDTIITLINAYNIDQTAAEHLYGASIIQLGGADIWDGVQVVAPAGTHMEIIQNGAIEANDFWNSIPFGQGFLGLNADSANGISHQFMLKVRTSGADIDGRRFVATTREFGSVYGERKINGTGRGVNVVALPGGGTDLNNATAEGTVSGWTGITNTTEGYIGIDVNNDTVNEFYYSEWNRDTFSINQFYERMKWLTRRGSVSTIYGLNGEVFRGITHEIDVDTPTGTFNAFEAVSWGTGATAGTAQMLAINSTTAATKMWIQLLTGVIPTDGLVITGGTSSASVAMNVTIVERNISAPFIGASTGSAIIGAYGAGIEALDLTASDLLFDLTDTPRNPPNFVTFSVGGLESGEDNVLVGPRGYRFEYDNEAVSSFVVGETLTFTSPAGTAVVASVLDRGLNGEIVIGPMTSGVVPVDNSTITAGTSGTTADVFGPVSNAVNLRQLTLNGTLSGAAVTAVVVNETIPSDTPSTGTIRVERANGAYSLHPYSAWATSTFTITAHDFSTINATTLDNVFISYIDTVAASATETFTSVYSADRSLFIRVRDGGVTPIKTFETTGTLGSAGGSSTANRISDL
jgi:hypothetical protein